MKDTFQSIKKNNFISLVLLLSVLFHDCTVLHKRTNRSSIVKNTYFGENPPKLFPKRFEPKQLSPNKRFEGGTFSPDLKVFYFTRKDEQYKTRKFYVTYHKRNKWEKPIETNITWPQFSADGNTMYVGKTYRIKTKQGWSEPQEQGEFLKHMAHGMSVSARGTYYFAAYKKEDKGVHGAIYSYNPNNTKNGAPLKLDPEINSGTYIAHPYIAQDESYLLWDMVREDSKGQADIYISFKQNNGTWSHAIPMENGINTSEQESSPSVSPDGNYLFFMRTTEKERKDGSRYQIVKQYWVDAQIIETLRSKLISNENSDPLIEQKACIPRIAVL